MLKNLKSLELTRHHLYNKTKRIISDITKDEETNFSKLSEVIFSSALSLFLTYLAEKFFVSEETLNVCKVVLLFICAIVIYCILYIIISKIYSIVTKFINNFIYNKKIHSPDFSAEKCKLLVDDFDHIAFDNIIISYELLNEIKPSANTELNTFYYHEILYYLKTAIKITKEIVHPNRREQCLNIFGNQSGVDIYRLCNICNSMKRIYTEIEKFTSNSIIDFYDLKDSLLFDLSEIKDSIDSIDHECTVAKMQLEPKK